MKEDIFVTRAVLPPFEEYVDEIRSIWDSHWLTNMGVKHQRFEAELKEYLGIDHLELVVNGHMALELTLQAMNLMGEVITTPFTFASTTHAIVRNGLKPVFADIKLDDYTIDVDSVESLITDRTSAIMPVHVYGNVCEVERLQKLADKYGLKVIYDAAHAFGVELDGRGIAYYGDASCFSFHATKVFNSIEGGAVAYRDEALGRRLYRLKNFGIRGPEEVDGVGANAKMNEFAAAMGLCNLGHLDEAIEARARLAAVYRQRLSGLQGVKLTEPKSQVKSNYAYMPILIDEKAFGASRNEVMKALADKNIFARKYFYPLTSSFVCFHKQFDPAETPVAQYVSNRIITLPLYDTLTELEVHRICDVILKSKK